MFGRMGSLLITKKMESPGRLLVNSIFARGLAAAVIAQIAVIQGIPHAVFIAKVTYVVITGTILLSSVRVFIYKRKFPLPIGKENAKHRAKTVRSAAK